MRKYSTIYTYELYTIRYVLLSYSIYVNCRSYTGFTHSTNSSSTYAHFSPTSLYYCHSSVLLPTVYIIVGTNLFNCLQNSEQFSFSTQQKRYFMTDVALRWCRLPQSCAMRRKLENSDHSLHTLLILGFWKCCAISGRAIWGWTTLPGRVSDWTILSPVLHGDRTL